MVVCNERKYKQLNSLAIYPTMPHFKGALCNFLVISNFAHINYNSQYKPVFSVFYKCKQPMAQLKLMLPLANYYFLCQELCAPLKL